MHFRYLKVSLNNCSIPVDFLVTFGKCFQRYFTYLQPNFCCAAKTMLNNSKVVFNGVLFFFGCSETHKKTSDLLKSTVKG
jgi:hypothetical protein